MRVDRRETARGGLSRRSGKRTQGWRPGSAGWGIP